MDRGGLFYSGLRICSGTPGIYKSDVRPCIEYRDGCSFYSQGHIINQGGEMMMKSVFLVEETGVPGGNHRPTASN